MSQSPTPPLRDSKSSLYEAAVAAVQDRNEKAAAERRGPLKPKRTARLWVLSLIGVAGLVILLLQPTWLTGPQGLPPEPAPIVAASLRLTLLRERQLVFDFANRRGRLPTDLTEAGAGAGLPDILYERTGGDSFRLSAQAGDSIIVLRSTDSMALFLGASLKEIKNRGRL